MMKLSRSSSWPDLQPELLGLVMMWLPNLADRIRLRAVCHPWRSNSLLQPLPPPNPCLTLLDGSFLSIPGGEIIRMPELDDACCCGSIDNWLFLTRSDGRCSLFNPFSKSTVDLPKLATIWQLEPFNAYSTRRPCSYKLAVPSLLDSSPDSLIAVLILDDVGFDFSRGKPLDPFQQLLDVTFFDGKLYGVGCGDKLFKFKISDGLGRIIWETCGTLPKPLSREKTYILRKYLVECCGRLLMVNRRIGMPRPILTADDYFAHALTAAFEVFEADLSTKPSRWRRVNKHCSKSFPAGMGNGIKEEDCIYFMCDYPPPDFAADPLRDSGVYNITNGIITPLIC
ncbi:hypothetical protein BS78_10G042100, partial [Paspalum vaginatum]